MDRNPNQRLLCTGYSVTEGFCARRAVRRLGLLFLWSAAAVLFIYLSMLLMSVYIWVLGALLEATVIALTVPFLTLEYDYELFDGEFSAARVYGGKYRRVAFSVSLRGVTAIFPCGRDAERRLERARPARTVNLTRGDTEQALVMLYTDRTGKLTALRFDGDAKFDAAAKFYCPAALRR